MITLAVLTVGLLGSCSKINERIDNLEKKVDGLENEKIASIENQITGINSSIADLGAIRSNIQSLTDNAKSQGQDITDLQAADKSLGKRIEELSKYVGDTLKAYATEEWARATFSTLGQYEKTCDTIAKIDARIGALDENLSKKIADCADSLTTWINGQFEGYYTAAQMDAKLALMKSAVDSAKAAGEITDAKADSLAVELAKVQPAIDSAKAQLTREYTAAIDTAIKTCEGKLTKQIQDEIEKVNETVTALAERVGTLEFQVTDLLGRVGSLEKMIQSVTIIPDYSDGSLKVENGSLSITCIISPASAAEKLKKENVIILVKGAVSTKAVAVDTVKIARDKDLVVDKDKGTVKIKADISDLRLDDGKSFLAAVKITKGISNHTTSFVQVSYPDYIEDMVNAAYAIFTKAEDVNYSFSLWNFDIRSDDAYKGGASPKDHEFFHQLEIGKGFNASAWNINGIWERLYTVISRVNAAIVAVEKMDEAGLRNQRLGELRFLRAYAHFQLKRLFKNIPFVLKADCPPADYYKIKNTEFTNDKGWEKLAEEVEYAFNVLPETQTDKGRPTKAAAAAFLAKIYLYKAYRQDNSQTNEVTTSVNQGDLQKVIEYTDESIYRANYALEDDLHNNFRPEERYENGRESIWAIQYSSEDNNLNWSYGLIVPAISGVTDGGGDFYKPSQNLVNAFRTNVDGLPASTNEEARPNDTTDPRLYLTVGMPALPYMFNADHIMDKSKDWSRSDGLYGYYVSLKQNVDPALKGTYLFHGPCWASPMNRIVFRYADVILMRAEAFAQLSNIQEAIKLVNDIRTRAKNSVRSSIPSYEPMYGVHLAIALYRSASSKDEAMKIVKTERRLELAMEAERFFDLVRWGDAESVLKAYFSTEKAKCPIYNDAEFTANRNEYLPIPSKQISASKGNYTQNPGW